MAQRAGPLPKSGYPLPLQRALPKFGLAKPATIAAFVILAASALAAGVNASRPADKECRTVPRPMRLAQEIDATMKIRGGMPCPIIAQLKTASVRAIEVTIPPGRGKLTARGRIGFIYHPDAKFRGEDFFEFAMDGQSGNGDALRSVVRVRVSVD